MRKTRRLEAPRESKYFNLKFEVLLEGFPLLNYLWRRSVVMSLRNSIRFHIKVMVRWLIFHDVSSGIPFTRSFTSLLRRQCGQNVSKWITAYAWRILRLCKHNGYINPYYWVDDHPLLYGNNGSLDPGTYQITSCNTCDVLVFCSTAPPHITAFRCPREVRAKVGQIHVERCCWMHQFKAWSKTPLISS